MKKFLLLLIGLLPGAVLQARADVTLNPLFVDGAVLQQGVKVPVWGIAEPGERITVEIAGNQQVATTAEDDGKWMASLKPLKASMVPVTLIVQGKNRITVTNILIGEVWICSGQSNMERHLGLQQGQKPIVDWEQEVKDANYPEIRQFYVVQRTAFTPQTIVTGSWAVCSPETVKDFSAVGYFFGRDLHKARKVPVGLIHTSWGGTPAEAWTSEKALSGITDFARPLEELKRMIADPEGARRDYEGRLESWFRTTDPGSSPGKTWSAVDLDATTWKTMKLPTLWENSGETNLANFDGVMWFRKTFELPETAAGAEAMLDLGHVDDIDTTWVNGVQVGTMSGYSLERHYTIPAGVLKPGKNFIAIRVLDTGGGGGIWGDQNLQLVLKGVEPFSLAGPWQYNIGRKIQNGPWPPVNTAQSPSAPTVLYNAMIAPLVPYAMRGVIWYQGEANVGRERQYRTLFPALIADWRRAWDENFPFLFVQIAPFNGMTPEIRDAQLRTWRKTKNTAMVVTLDCGDANDIHPANKGPVGARLALAARAVAYGEKIEYSGPLFESMKSKGTEVVLTFSHLGGGLVAKDGPLTGFFLAGTDGIFHPADARINGDNVMINSASVGSPDAVRYGWGNVPEGNLFNKAGLPASPFQTGGE